VATTSGTGSEVTKVSVLINREADLKKSMRDPDIMPDVSITDPELTVPCPPGVTAASGMDAFVQAVESYLSSHAIPVTESLSLRAASLVQNYLPAAYEDGEDREARYGVAQGSYMAGLALGSARLGAVHGLAHPVGLLFDRPHGEVCAALLPEVLRRNKMAAGEKYDTLRHALRGDPVARTEALLDDLELDRTLGSYPDGAGEDMVTDYALDSGSSAANPVQVTPDYVRGVLEAITE
jgi:alcohol dehydrogenase class IV